MELHFSLAVELGSDILVASLDTAFTPQVPDGYTIRIAPDLVEQGYKLVDGKIILPGQGLQAALILRDDSFKELRVVKPTKALLTASAAKGKGDYDKKVAELGEIIKLIEPESELGELITIVVNFDYDTIRAELEDLAMQITALDLDRLQTDIEAFKKKLADKQLSTNNQA